MDHDYFVVSERCWLLWCIWEISRLQVKWLQWVHRFEALFFGGELDCNVSVIYPHQSVIAQLQIQNEPMKTVITEVSLRQNAILYCSDFIHLI